MSKTRTLRLVLGDQLSRSISSLRDIDLDHDTVLMAEVKAEATYVRHHKKKIAFLFSAMRHFAAALEDEGIDVRYVRHDDQHNEGSLAEEVRRAVRDGEFDQVVVTECGEYRLAEDMAGWARALNMRVEIRDDDRFIASHGEFDAWAEGRKTLRMEFFYREMRRKTGILLEPDGSPTGGQWNYDADNRDALPDTVTPPDRLGIEADAITRAVIMEVDAAFADHFGDLEPFDFAVTAEDAEALFTHFLDVCLPQFGTYQDAMRAGDPFLFHSLIGQYLNAGLLDPLACCEAAEKRYQNGKVRLNAAEGCIRQILGWREFVRGIYWREMPDYKKRNTFGAKRPLPDFFWTGDTRMACIRDTVATTKANAYAHHIQRLMITGNFALLAGLSPDEVNEWYLIVYADAYEWVQLPNTHGMALFADEGLLASKPYAASGAYINRMSNYCKSCHYKVSKKNGEQACPFNYLYWNFLIENEKTLEDNPRLAMPYRTLAKMNADRREAVAEDSARFFREISSSSRGSKDKKKEKDHA